MPIFRSTRTRNLRMNASQTLRFPTVGLALLAGCLLLTSACQSEAPPSPTRLESEKQNWPAGGSPAPSASTQGSSAQGSPDQRTPLQSSLGETAWDALQPALTSDELDELPEDVDKLFQYLNWKLQEISNWRGTQPRSLKVAAKNIERAASQALTHSLTAEQEQLATKAKMNALLTLAQLGENEVHEPLRQLANSLAEQASPLAESAGITLLFLELAQLARLPDADLTDFHAQAQTLVQRFPQSLDLFQNLYDIGCRRLKRLGRQQDAILVMELLLETYHNHPSVEIQTGILSLPSQIRLTRLEFDRKVVDLQQHQVGAPAAYLHAVKTLLSHEKLDLFDLSEIEKSLSWLEINQRYKIAQEANQRVLECLESIPASMMRDTLLHQSKMRSQRLKRVGEPLEFPARLADGSMLDWETLQGKVIMVLFWSSADHPSWQVYKKAAHLSDSLQTSGMRLLSVYLAPDTEPLQTLFPNGLPVWPIIVEEAATDDSTTDDSPSQQLAERFGVSSVPFIILVDRKGIVREFVPYVDTKQNQAVLVQRLHNLLSEPDRN